MCNYKKQNKKNLSFLASDVSAANNPTLDSRSWLMVDLRTFFVRARVLNDRSADATDTVVFRERVDFCSITTQLLSPQYYFLF